jgi:hypothetical protein
MIESWTKESFEERVGETFDLHLGGAPVPFKLVEVRAGAAPPNGRAQFSLVFRGPKTALRSQGIYRVEHAAIGAHEIFLVPVGVTADDGGSVLFEAIFT